MRHFDDSASTQLGTGPNGYPASKVEPLDPELLAIHAPPQSQRVAALTIMAAAVVAMMALLLSLRAEISYALSQSRAVDLAHVLSVEPRKLVPNSYVRLTGTATIGHSFGFTRGFGARYRVFPLAGQRSIYVQVRDLGNESFVQSEYTGRLVTFDQLGGRYAELARVMEGDGNLPAPSESYLLMADEPPSSYTWTLFVAVACIAFVLLDVFFIVRWFRPVPWALAD